MCALYQDSVAVLYCPVLTAVLGWWREMMCTLLYRWMPAAGPELACRNVENMNRGC